MHSAISRLPKTQHLDNVVMFVTLLPFHTTLDVCNTHPDYDKFPKAYKIDTHIIQIDKSSYPIRG